MECREGGDKSYIGPIQVLYRTRANSRFPMRADNIDCALQLTATLRFESIHLQSTETAIGMPYTSENLALGG